MDQMIDRRHIGLKLPSATMLVEAGALRLFAKATGQTDPIFFDEQAAQRAGYRSIVAAPTYCCCLYAIGRCGDTGVFEEIGLASKKILHGQQRIEYEKVICGGDFLRVESEITDIYAKKGGSLEFIVQRFTATNQAGERVALLHATAIFPN
jgi:acyl dehydratase